MKTLQQMDDELERLGKLHQRVWGEICQLRVERNFALMQHARETARAEPSTTYQPAQWNENGHRNDNFDMEEMIR
jgi:hypothetical protein